MKLGQRAKDFLRPFHTSLDPLSCNNLTIYFSAHSLNGSLVAPNAIYATQFLLCCKTVSFMFLPYVALTHLAKPFQALGILPRKIHHRRNIITYGL